MEDHFSHDLLCCTCLHIEIVNVHDACVISIIANNNEHFYNTYIFFFISFEIKLLLLLVPFQNEFPYFFLNL